MGNSNIKQPNSHKNLDVALATRDQKVLFNHVHVNTNGSIWPVCQSKIADNLDALYADSMGTSIIQKKEERVDNLNFVEFPEFTNLPKSIPESPGELNLTTSVDSIQAFKNVF